MDDEDVTFVCEELRACRVCLATDVKLEVLYPSGLLAETFEQFTGKPVSPTDDLPRHLCTMCAALLKKSAAFRYKCRNTHDFLQRVRKRIQPLGTPLADVEITMTVIRQLDRKYLKLPYVISNTVVMNSLEDISNVDMIEIPIEKETRTESKEESEEDCIPNEDCDDDYFNTDGEPVEQCKEEEILIDLNVAETGSPDPIADDDNMLKLKRKRVTANNREEKIKEYLSKSKAKKKSNDSYKRLFYNHLVDKYLYKTKKSNCAEEYVILDSDAGKDTIVKLVHNSFDDSVISEKGDAVADNTELDKNKFYNYIRDKYVNKTETKKKRKVVNVSKVRVGTLKHDKRIKTKEELDEFAKTYNFDIIRMTKDEQILELEQRKKSSLYQHATYKCEECFRGFQSITVYENHMEVHDPTSGSHICEVCKHRFPTLLKLNNHSQQHKMKYVCRECKQRVRSSLAAKEHHKAHTVGVSYDCKHCDVKFRKYASLSNHCRIHHSATMCDICYVSFQGARGMKQHKDKVHKQTHQCATCGVHFDNADAMIGHIGASSDGACDPSIRACAKCGELCHTDEQFDSHVASLHAGQRKKYVTKKKPKACKIVVQKSNNVKRKKNRKNCCTCPHFESGKTGDGEYNVHSSEHSVPKSECNVPNTEYNVPSSEHSVPKSDSCPCGDGERVCLCPRGSALSCRLIDRSRRTNKDDAFPKHSLAHWRCCRERRLRKTRVIMCEVCAGTFQNELTLRTHQRIHTGEKPFQCNDCPRRFRTKTLLQNHKPTHTGERLYKCSLCPKAFKTPSANHRHQLVHTQMRPHRCDVCDKKFQTTTDLKTHVKSIHMKIPQPRRVRSRKRKIERRESVIKRNIYYVQK